MRLVDRAGHPTVTQAADVPQLGAGLGLGGPTEQLVSHAGQRAMPALATGPLELVAGTLQRSPGDLAREQRGRVLWLALGRITVAQLARSASRARGQQRGRDDLDPVLRHLVSPRVRRTGQLQGAYRTYNVRFGQKISSDEAFGVAWKFRRVTSPPRNLLATRHDS
jgi:hypothetical protein